jgi:hypothetical protein
MTAKATRRKLGVLRLERLLLLRPWGFRVYSKTAEIDNTAFFWKKLNVLQVIRLLRGCLNRRSYRRNIAIIHAICS